MSNKERPEMTNNIGIDLEAIPHPKDCHQVPVGATIPARTPMWQVSCLGYLEWSPIGYGAPFKVCSDDVLYLTIAPIVVPSDPPTPDDSPIILSIRALSGEYLAKEELAAWEPLQDAWRFVRGDGKPHWVDSEDIVEWSPAVVTKSGHGVWDERDKHDRVDADGDTWYWDKDFATWECAGDNRGCFGSLDAFRKWYGYDYLTGFADEQGGEE